MKKNKVDGAGDRVQYAFIVTSNVLPFDKQLADARLTIAWSLTLNKFNNFVVTARRLKMALTNKLIVNLVNA